MEIRRVKEQEIPQYWELVRYAFRNWQETPYSDEKGPWFVPEESYGLFKGNQLVSGIVSRRFLQTLRGAVKPMAGIAGVASLPEVRGQGAVRDLFRSVFDTIRSTRPVSMLHPFRESFYERLGYTAAPSILEIGMPTEGFSHHRGADRGYLIDRRGGEAHDEFLDWVSSQAPWLYHGFVLRDPENPDFWSKRHVEDSTQYLFLRKDGEVRVAGSYRARSRVRPSRLEFNTVIWKDPPDRNAFFGFCARHLDQIAEIRMQVPHDAPLHSWARDTMRNWTVELDEKPWMVRVLDVPGALEGIETDAEERCVFSVNDPLCSWNTGTFEIRGRDGMLSVDTSDETSDIRLDIKGLSALVYGTLDTEELRLRGWLDGTDAGALDRLLPRIPFFNTTHF